MGGFIKASPSFLLPVPSLSSPCHSPQLYIYIYTTYIDTNQQIQEHSNNKYLSPNKTQMEMEVVLSPPSPPPPALDFNFDNNSACSSPYMSAPSSPQRFGNFFFSAPTSPSRTSAFYEELNDAVSVATDSPSNIPFDWEEKPGTPKARKEREDSKSYGDCDFEFDFSGQLEKTSLSADELFDKGKIRPLKPPPGYVSSVSSAVTFPKSSSSPRSRRSQNKDFDPFQAAIEETRKRELKNQNEDHNQDNLRQRGRYRNISGSSSTSRKGSRSLSPLRVSDIMLEQEESYQRAEMVASVTSNHPKSSSSSSSLSSMSFSKRNKKWRLRDLLLFRSASEGRATTSKGPLITKYALLSKRAPEASEGPKNASFRSVDSRGESSSRRRGGGPAVSAHELHYTTNRAVSEEMKRKTFLPYKHGLFGCMRFNPNVNDVSRGIGFLTRG